MSKGHIMGKNSRAAQAMTPQQIASQYNQTMLQNAYNPYVQSTYVHTIKDTIDDWQLEKSYCIDGRWMNLEEFVNYLYPEDCAEKTYLILKLKGQKDENNS